jgi:hypothetical protein
MAQKKSARNAARKSPIPQDAPASTPAERGALAWGVAAATTIFASALLVILKEVWSPARAALVTLGTHHWLGHALLMLALYIGSGVTLSRIWKKGQAPLSAGGVAAAIAGSAASGGGLMLLFYALHYWLG